jgi:hypothetical protein
MYRFLIFLLSLVALATPASSWAATSTSSNLAINVTPGQAITGITLSNNTFTGGAPSGTVAGTISVTMSPATPAFSGSLSLSGTNASQFQISGSNLVTNGTVPAGTYNINIGATESGVSGSPFTQAETVTGSSPAPTGVQKPGPSQALFDNPYYTCVRNFYVATNGSGSNNGTSPSTPWLTIANYEAKSGVNPTAGDCVNVAPGTYSAGNNSLTKGGNAATSTGYIVYRCQTLDGCTITASDWAFAAGVNSWMQASLPASFLIFDGFVYAASGGSPNSDAVSCSNYPSTSQFSGCHHWMVLNSIAYNHQLDGFHMVNGEYFYVSHNTIHNNAYQCGVYGSGISFASLRPVQYYTPTADDINTNNNAALNLIGLYGQSNPFHNVVAWNVVYNNAVNCNGNQVASDGNGIIMDSFNTTNGNTINYAAQTLIAFNVIYNNGGAGVNITASSNVTVVNNSCFHNSIDPYQNATYRPCIGTGGGSNSFPNSNLILNNIAFSYPPSGACQGGSFGSAYGPQNGEATAWGDDNNGGDAVYNTPGRNITDKKNNLSCMSENVTNANPAWSCTANKCTTDPLWVAVSGTGGNGTSVGTETTSPANTNFALQSSSPAIGYGVTETWLPAQSVDVGACHHSLTSCP